MSHATPAPQALPPVEAARFTGGRTLLLGCGGGALLGWAATALGLAFTTDRMLFSYLTAWSFFLGLVLGCLCWVQIFHAAKARFSVVIRRLMEAVAPRPVRCCCSPSRRGWATTW